MRILSDPGAGTILEALRTPSHPRVMVVPNASLMDDHQRELADAMAPDYCLLGDLPYAALLTQLASYTARCPRYAHLCALPGP